ncbi:TlyA family RNA methyltransferase [Candidatus Stoquefichus massiliensis]|uniref:TlyA family RNA methyltransferase n=1 Tax=Candidatus Stoquefichus massiliensis TaxID=1470350 RepID=UPI0004820388|nr:TlyA family RNA methyltransferase [Candidatus Stoquefichus massiliensis]
MKKERVDILCVEQGLFDSREKAKRAIMAGIVRDDYDYIDKPGTKIPIDSHLYIKGEQLRYVSRGGLKLEKAIEKFHLQLDNLLMLDIGSSTGGFTDCALQNNVREVYALDVGTNQLVWKLRNDPRVHVMEQTNFRYATPDMFQYGQPEFASIDVSFISLKHILQPLSQILKPECYVVALIKPQFEAGKEDVGKHGIVSDPAIHYRVIDEVFDYAHKANMSIQGLTYSPITGGVGNIEFLGCFKNHDNHDVYIDIEDVVNQAHQHFKG